MNHYFFWNNSRIVNARLMKSCFEEKMSDKKARKANHWQFILSKWPRNILSYLCSRLKEYILNVHKKMEEQEKDTDLICKRLENANQKNENLEIRRREFEQIADRMTDARNRLQEEFDNFKRYEKTFAANFAAYFRNYYSYRKNQ